MPRQVGVTFHDVHDDDDLTFLQFPIDTELQEVRTRWHRERGEPTGDFHFTLDNGTEIPEHGTLRTILPPNSFVLAVEVTKLRHLPLACRGVSDLARRVKFHSGTSVADLIAEAKREVGVSADREARIFIDDRLLAPNEVVESQLPSEECAITLDLKVSVLVFDVAEVFPPLVEVESGLSYASEWSMFTAEGQRPCKVVSCFASDNVQCLMKAEQSLCDQRLIETNTLRVVDVNATVADLLEDREILQKRTVMSFLERLLAIDVNNNLSQGRTSLTVWPSTKIEKVLAEDEDSVFWNGRPVCTQNSFLVERITSAAPLVLSQRVQVRVITSDGQNHSLQMDQDTTLEKLREHLEALETHANFKVWHNGQEVVCDDRPLRCLQSEGTVILKIFYRTRDVQITYGSETRFLPNVSEAIQFSDLLTMVGEAFNELFPQGTQLKCPCGRILAEDLRQRRSFPIQCCDDEVLDLTLYLPEELEPSAPPQFDADYEGQLASICASASNYAANANRNAPILTDTIKLLLAGKGDVEHKDASGQTLLHKLAAAGETEAVRFLITSKANVAAKRKDGYIPLHLAALQGHTETIRLLLDNRTDVNARGADKRTALHVAAQKGHWDCAQLLIERGADVTSQSKNGLTPLHLAAFDGHVTMIELLLSCRSDPNLKTADGFTPLHTAAQFGHIDALPLLINAGADRNAKSVKGSTPLHMAVSHNMVHAVSALTALGCDANIANNEGSTPLNYAAFHGRLEIAQILLAAHSDLNFKTNTGCTALHTAIIKQKNDVARLLIFSGCDINAQTNLGSTPLHLAAAENNLDAARLLIDSGCDLYATKKDGNTALHVAAAAGHTDVAQLLLAMCGGLNVENANGITPLHCASVKNQLAMARLLIDSGCDINRGSHKGSTPLHLAAGQGHLEIVRLLIDSDCNVNAKSQNRATALHVAAESNFVDVAKLLLAVNCDETCTTVAEGFLPIHYAAKNGHLEVLQALVDDGCAVDGLTTDGRSGLHVAAEKGHLEVARFFIGAGVDVNKTSNEGKTSLHFAAGGGHLEVVRLLLDSKCDGTTLTNDGTSAESLAAANGHQVVVKVIREATKKGPLSFLLRKTTNK